MCRHYLCCEFAQSKQPVRLNMAVSNSKQEGAYSEHHKCHGYSLNSRIAGQTKGAGQLDLTQLANLSLNGDSQEKECRSVEAGVSELNTREFQHGREII